MATVKHTMEFVCASEAEYLLLLTRLSQFVPALNQPSIKSTVTKASTRTVTVVFNDAQQQVV